MMNVRTVATISAIVLSGGLFGFFFTMQFSIMPGLDLTEPYSALLANMMIGRATQSSYLIVLLLGTPVTLGVAMALSMRTLERDGIGYLGSALLSWMAMLAVTLFFNVPLNQVLDGLILTPDMADATEGWAAYSQEWQQWNLARVLFSVLSSVFAVLALIRQRKNLQIVLR